MFLLALLLSWERVEPCMGTLFRIVVHGEDAPAAQQAMDAAFNRGRELDAKFSDYRPDSEINRLTGGRVSDDVWTVLAAARRLTRESNGAFDITFGPVIRLWRDARRAGRLPTGAELARARARAGWRRVHLDPANRTARTDPGAQLDFGGIVKGYAAGCMLAVLRERGFPHSLVAAGGDIAVGDAPPGQPGWRIQLDWTNQQLTLNNCAVSTSGDTEQWVEIGGARYSHIVDPRTGLGLRNSSPVTVIAPTGLLADPLATALSVLPRKEGDRLLQAFPEARALRP